MNTNGRSRVFIIWGIGIDFDSDTDGDADELPNDHIDNELSLAGPTEPKGCTLDLFSRERPYGFRPRTVLILTRCGGMDSDARRFAMRGDRLESIRNGPTTGRGGTLFARGTTSAGRALRGAGSGVAARRFFDFRKAGAQ